MSARRDVDGTGTATLEPLGDSAVILRFGSTLDAAINARVHQAAEVLRAALLGGVHEIVPAYASLTVHYDPAAFAQSGRLPFDVLGERLLALLTTPVAAIASTSRLIEIPVCYGGEFGADLAAIAAQVGLGEDAVIAAHCGGDYRVAMLGFAPGFAYLLGLDPRLHLPRRAEPRLRVPAGSVAIGGGQTGIYPSELPGGWQLLGRTPLRLFDSARDPPARLAPGDRVRFIAIDAEEFARLQATNA